MKFRQRAGALISTIIFLAALLALLVPSGQSQSSSDATAPQSSTANNTNATTTTPQFPLSLYADLQWRCIGPFRGGRTVAATGVPNNPNLFYIGVNNGGVWKTTDAGRTWIPIFDGQPTGSIGALAVAPSNPDIIYVGSGEGLRRRKYLATSRPARWPTNHQHHR